MPNFIQSVFSFFDEIKLAAHTSYFYKYLVNTFFILLAPGLAYSIKQEK